MRRSTRIPDHLLNPHRDRAGLHELKARLRRARLHTVCESAKCPNIIECFKRPQAAFMIMGNHCLRGCRFCAVTRGEQEPLDPDEPMEIAEAAAELDLSHVVVTSVTRDDLPDGGSSHFAAVIRALKDRLPDARVEVLVPDFSGDKEAIATVMDAGPHVFNHNVETVPRLYSDVRPAADYERSLSVLAGASRLARENDTLTVTKSGLMVGLGESVEEVIQVLHDLKGAGCGMATVGQYLQPRKSCLAVQRYWEPEEYEPLREAGLELGIHVFAGPLVRSSYLADRAFDEMRGD